MVVAAHGRHTSCVFWPPVPAEALHPEPDVVPSTGDASVATWYEEQIMRRAAEAGDPLAPTSRLLHLGDMFLVSERLLPPEPVCQTGSPTFLQFLPRAVPRRETGTKRAVAAIALLLPYVHSVSDGAPSIELLFRERASDSQDRGSAQRPRLAFVSAWVTASSAWQALDDEDADDSESSTFRSRRGTPSLQAVIRNIALSQLHLVEQSREFMAGLPEDKQSGTGSKGHTMETVIDRAYRLALYDELELVHGIGRSVTASSLQGTSIANLQVHKDAGADILARIYRLELTPGSATEYRTCGPVPSGLS